MRALSLVVGTALVAVLAGCSDDPGPTADRPTETGPSTPASATHAADDGSEKGAAATYSPRLLRSALLTLDDMPESGFTSYDDSADRQYFCDYTPPKKPTDMVSSQFEKSEGLSIFLVRSAIDQYASATDAKANFDKMVAVLETCKTDTDESGNKFAYKMMSGPSLGDDSAAVEITGEIDGVDLVMHQFYALEGTAMIQTSAAVGGMAFPDADKVGALSETVYGRYVKLGR